MKRLNTQLESVGAEYLVLGNLLRLRIQSFVTSQNFEHYDVVATNPEKNITVKIQVKSRFPENASRFLIKKFGSDFVVFVKLNCGRRKKGHVVYEYKKSPEFYIFPTKICEKFIRKGNWHKIILKDIPDYNKYKDNWNLIRKALKIKI